MSGLSQTDYPILTVSQLSQAIKHCLEKTFPQIWLQGEISNCKLNTSGHLYFSLKDPHSQISAVMFRPDVALLKITPKDGVRVIAKGELNVYPPSGKYQLLVRELRLVGLGELLLKLEELKVKLHKQGWFRSERKRPIPKFPRRIGVVTSPTGAAIQDMLNILTRRFSGFHLILNPVKVQGEGAAQEIAQAIRQFNTYDLADVLIVGRGGGSIEDLWAFNEEIVAEAIFNSRIPVISAVGHETDHCIADYVADVRAPTPSAAAELVIAEKAHQLHLLSQMQRRMQQTVTHLIRQDRHRLQGLMRHPVLQTPFGVLGPWSQRLDLLRQDIGDAASQYMSLKRFLLMGRRQLLSSLKPATRLDHYRQKLAVFDKEIRGAVCRKILLMQTGLEKAAAGLQNNWRVRQTNRFSLLNAAQKARQLDALWKRSWRHSKERLENIKNSLDAINPKYLLAKGYCILFSEKEGSAITSVRFVEKDQNVQILLADGHLQATIKDVVPE